MRPGEGENFDLFVSMGGFPPDQYEHDVAEGQRCASSRAMAHKAQYDAEAQATAAHAAFSTRC